MAVACCRFCYQKYIEEDKSLDREFIKNNIFSNYSILRQPTSINIKIKLDEDIKVPLPIGENITLSVDGQLHEICTCLCHIKGCNVRH